MSVKEIVFSKVAGFFTGSFQGFYIDFSDHLFFQNHSETTLFLLKETCEQNETILRP